MNLQERILQDGVQHGMCEKFQKLLSEKELTVDEMCALYHKGLDFCIEQDWPSKEIVDEFPIDVLSRNGIYYDMTGKIDAKLFTVINGDSNLTVVVQEGKVTSMYVRHNSKIKLIVEDGAFCYISCHDNADVKVVSKAPSSKLKCSLFSGNIEEDKFDKVNYK